MNAAKRIGFVPIDNDYFVTIKINGDDALLTPRSSDAEQLFSFFRELEKEAANLPLEGYEHHLKNTVGVMDTDSAWTRLTISRFDGEWKVWICVGPSTIFFPIEDAIALLKEYDSLEKPEKHKLPSFELPAAEIDKELHHVTNGVASCCRVRVYKQGSREPVVVITELEKNKGPSITNSIEDIMLNARLMIQAGGLRLPNGAIFVEHYTKDSYPGYINRLTRDKSDSFAKVSLSSDGKPVWKDLSTGQISEMVDCCH